MPGDVLALQANFKFWNLQCARTVCEHLAANNNRRCSFTIDFTSNSFESWAFLNFGQTLCKRVYLNQNKKSEKGKFGSQFGFEISSLLENNLVSKAKIPHIANVPSRLVADCKFWCSLDSGTQKEANRRRLPLVLRQRLASMACEIFRFPVIWTLDTENRNIRIMRGESPQEHLQSSTFLRKFLEEEQRFSEQLIETSIQSLTRLSIRIATRY